MNKFSSWFKNSRKRQQTVTRFLQTAVLTGLVMSGGIILVRQLGGLEAAELDAYDWLMRHRPAEPVDERLLVVGVNEDDLQRRQEYPLSDSTVAQVLSKLETYQPRAIALDIARDVPQGKGRDTLTKVLQNNKRILSGCVLSSQSEPGVAPAPGVPAERVGFADFPLDPRGIVRRSILISAPTVAKSPVVASHVCNDADANNELLSLSLLLSLVYLEDEGIPVEQTDKGYLQLGSVIIPRLSERAAGYRQNGATDYQVMLNYRASENAIRVVSLTEVLEGKVNPKWVKDRLVLIGYTSTVAKDYFLTPFSGVQAGALGTPGVVIHAQSTSQLLAAVLDGRPLIWYWPTAVEFLWIFAWAIAGGMIGFYLAKIWQFVLAAAVVVGLLLGACYGLFLSGGWVPFTPSLLAIMGTAFGTALIDRSNRSGYSQALLEQTKAAVKSVFSPIEVNEAAKEAQVAEITSSSFFQDLAQRAKEIREKRDRYQQTEESDTSD